MIERLAPRILLFLLACRFASPMGFAEPAAQTAAAQTAVRLEAAEKSTNLFHPISPGPIDGRIAWVTAALLQQGHYLQQAFDANVSSKFFDRYFDSLDPQHLHFLQSDLAEFEPYRTNLNRLTLPPHGSVGDTRPACEIFNRYMERLEQRVAYVDELLKKDQFRFDSDERIIFNRHELPYPKDLAEAKRLWRERLRSEYLQEKLGKDAAKKKTAASTQPGLTNPPSPVNPADTIKAFSSTSSTGNTLSNSPALVHRVDDSKSPVAASSVPVAAASGEPVHTPVTSATGSSVAEPAGKPSPAVSRARPARALVSPKFTPSAAELLAQRSVKTNAAAAVALARLRQEAEARRAAQALAKAEQDRLAAEQVRAQAQAEAQRAALAQSPKPAPAPVHVEPPKKTEVEEIVETLARRYHRTLHAFAEWGNDEVLERYLTTLARVYDPHSDYMGHAQLDSFSISMNLSLFGIGAELSSAEDGYCTIRRLLPGGPADKSKKIKANDRIVAVAQGGQTPVDVVDMSLSKAVQLIRGPKGSEVRLTVIPAGADSSTRTVVTLIRDEIPLEDQAAKAKIIEAADACGQPVRLGVIDLPSFYAPFDVGGSKRDAAKANDSGSTKSTTGDVARLLAKLKEEQVKGVILDLRRNGGGSLEEAIHLTGLFIKDGPVVQVRSPRARIERDEDTDPSIAYEGPLMVLTSRFSASASEIVAGALQDYGRALIVGDASTHGKGTVQMVNMLRPAMQLPESQLTNDPGALKLTIKKFYRPSGASTQLKGVVPDIILPSIWNESKDVGESALENPLPWDTIESAKYDAVNMVAPYVADLRARSSQRLATNTEFAYVREDIDLFKKQQADKTISLNEALRIKEKNEAEARQKARDRERLSRPLSTEKVYELSLKQALLPGLPPPVELTNSTARLTLLKDAGSSTNSAAAQVAENVKPTSDDDEEEKPPAVDATLAEAEHILTDYLGVLTKPGVFTAGKSL